MLVWIKEHKQYVIAACVFIVVFGYYLLSTYLQSSTFEEDNWDITTDSSELEMIGETEEVQVTVDELLVDVKGAVHKPGVYKATTGERVVDLIEKAGGLTEVANSIAINFAMRVTDEMVVYVPFIGEEENVMDSSIATIGGNDNGKININKASQAELETLPGIGPSKAQAIIEYRETSGPFKTIEDIMSISGFGEKTFEKLKESIRVN